MDDTLHQREQMAEALLEAIPDLVFRLNKDGTFLGFLPAKGQLPALPPTDFLGKNVRDVLPPELALRTMRYVKKALKTGDAQTFEYQLPLPLPDGDLREFEARLVMSGEDGVLAIARDITDRKRAEAAAKQSEAKWSSLVENAPVLIMVVRDDGTIEFANQGVPGAPLEEAIGRTVYDYAPPKYHDDIRDVFAWIFETGESGGDFDVPWLEPSGNTSWRSVRVGPMKRDGEVIALTIVATDITERKRAEEALRESEQKYRRVVGDSIDGIAIAQGLDLKLVNRALVEMLGYGSEEEVLGRPLTDFVSSEDRELGAERAVRRQSGGRVPERQELKLMRKDGTELAVEVSVGMVTYDGSAASQAIVRDITERKRAEDALRESEQRLREILEASRDLIYKLDVKARNFDYLSPAVQRLTGFTPQEFIGMGFDGVAARIHPRDQLAFKTSPEGLPACLGEARTTSAIEYRWRCKDGRYRWLSNNWVLLRDDRGQPAAMVGAVRDITNRKRTEEALQRARERLEARVEARIDGANTYGLTFRELTVLHLVAGGRADKEIAVDLGIRPRTVSKHLENILRKMGADCRTEAGVRALREGLVG